MARGIKVAGHASLVRSAAIPGLILSNNAEAGAAALRARQRQQLQDNLIEVQAIQIAQLQDQLSMVLEHVGITPPVEDKSDDE